MSAEQIKQLADDLSAIKTVAEMVPKFHVLMKWVVAVLFAASVAISSVSFWVKVTTDKLSKLETSMTVFEAKRELTMGDWQAWRSSKDLIDARMTVIVENQQKLLDALTVQKLNRND